MKPQREHFRWLFLSAREAQRGAMETMKCRDANRPVPHKLPGMAAGGGGMVEVVVGHCLFAFTLGACRS